MPFSIGGHPAFKCPIHSDEENSDYFLELEHSETLQTTLLDEDGLLSNEKKTIVMIQITLNYTKTFDNDALIFTDIKSKKNQSQITDTTAL